MILAAITFSTQPLSATDLAALMAAFGGMLMLAGKGAAFIIREFKRKGGDAADAPPADNSDLTDLKTQLAVTNAKADAAVATGARNVDRMLTVTAAMPPAVLKPVTPPVAPVPPAKGPTP